jgi:hypothetical protein
MTRMLWVMVAAVEMDMAAGTELSVFSVEYWMISPQI